LLAAWALWNGRGTAQFGEVVQQLEPRVLVALAELLTAMANGSDAVDRWLGLRDASFSQLAAYGFGAPAVDDRDDNGDLAGVRRDAP
jgi:hypothetical protein